jgi:hypothetical protein
MLFQKKTHFLKEINIILLCLDFIYIDWPYIFIIFTDGCHYSITHKIWEKTIFRTDFSYFLFSSLMRISLKVAYAHVCYSIMVFSIIYFTFFVSSTPTYANVSYVYPSPVRFPRHRLCRYRYLTIQDDDRCSTL